MIYFDLALRNQTFATIGSRLLAQIRAVETDLSAISDGDAGRPLAPGKWSSKQVLGHLIDSAANNHQRFVRGQEEDPVILPGYAQSHWVGCQQYQERAWKDLVALWSAYNRHLAHILARVPEGRRDTRCEIGSNEPVTLSFVALDYVGHLQHHLRQMLGRRWREE